MFTTLPAVPIKDMAFRPILLNVIIMQRFFSHSPLKMSAEACVQKSHIFCRFWGSEKSSISVGP